MTDEQLIRTLRNALAAFVASTQSTDPNVLASASRQAVTAIAAADARPSHPDPETGAAQSGVQSHPDPAPDWWWMRADGCDKSADWCEPGPNAPDPVDGFTAVPLHAPSPAVTRETWRTIETAPKDGKKIIVWYANRCGNGRTVLAKWLTDERAAESDTDDVGLESGWYECIDNWDDYSQVAIHEGEPTYWMPMPAAPGAILSGSAPEQRGDHDPADIIAGALQCSRGYAYDLMRKAIASDAPEQRELSD